MKEGNGANEDEDVPQADLRETGGGGGPLLPSVRNGVRAVEGGAGGRAGGLPEDDREEESDPYLLQSGMRSAARRGRAILR